MTSVWKKFGPSGTFTDPRCLKAYLEDEASNSELERLRIPVPRRKDFSADSAFDVNPFSLELSQELLKTKFLIRTIAPWGPRVLREAAFVCAKYQVSQKNKIPAEFVSVQQEVFNVLQEYMHGDSPKSRPELDEVRRRCMQLYESANERSHEAAEKVWSGIGAPWFAIETMLQDFSVRKDCGEKGEASSNSTWIVRNSTWPERAAEVAGQFGSYEELRAEITAHLLKRMASS